VVVLLVLAAGLFVLIRPLMQAGAALDRARAARLPEATQRSWCLAPLLSAHTDLWFSDGTLSQLRPYLSGRGALPPSLASEVEFLRAGMPAFFGCEAQGLLGRDEASRLSRVPLAAVVIREELNAGDLAQAESSCLSALRWLKALGRASEVGEVEAYFEAVSLPCGEVLSGEEHAALVREVASQLPTPVEEAQRLYAARFVTQFTRLELWKDTSWLAFFEMRDDAQRCLESERVWTRFREASTDAERQKQSDAFDALLRDRRESLIQRWREMEALRGAVEALVK
jgi:hypothetical protein